MPSVPSTVRPTIVLLDDLLSLRAQTHANRPAIVAGGRTATYAELDAEATATARRLAALGVEGGSVVATTLSPSLAFAALLHATAKLGAALAPLNTRLTRAERAAQLDDSGARIVVDEPLDGEEAGIDGAAAGGAEQRDADWTVLFTSGTAGVPKPVRLSRRNHVASALASAWGLGVAPDDRWLCVLPLFHVGGLAILIRSAVYGTAAVVHERFDAGDAAASLGGGEVTLASLVPTMLRRIADEGLDSAPDVRAVLLGGASSPRDLLRWAAGRGLPVMRTYGMTETASQIATEALRPHGLSHGEDGARPLPGVQLRIGADEEVLVRGPMVARGSLASDGWLHTGDRGRLDDRGLLHVEGRLDEVIVTGGEKVAAREVEDALLSHGAVRDTAVIGTPDPEWGHAVTAFVVADGTVSAAELRDHCRRHVAGYKVPKRVVFVDSLPRNAAGKLARTALAAEASDPAGGGRARADE
jgi:o-succinylbenzoate---CoA ligase